MALTPDGQRAVSASLDGTLKVWDLESGQALRTLSGYAGPVLGVAVMPDGRHAISSSNDTTLNATTLNATTLKVWDLGSGRLIRTLSGHGGPVHGVAVTPNGRWAVSASDDHTLRVWDLESTRVLATFTCDGQAVCCACASDTQFVAGDAGGHVLFLELMLPKDH